MTVSLEQVTKEAGELSGVLIQESNALYIKDQNSLQAAAEYQQEAKREIKVIESAFKPHKKNAFKAHKDLCKAEADQLAPFKEIGAILKPKILEYRIAEAKREAKEKEEREAKQRQAEAEAKEAAKKTRDRQVEGLLDIGAFEDAEAVLEAPISEPVAAYVPEPEKVKVAGAGTKQVWKGRVLDFSKVPDKFKIIDQQAVNKYASALKDKAEEPGIEFYPDMQLTGK